LTKSWELLLLRVKKVDKEDEAREGEREREKEWWLMGARPSGRANGKIKNSPNFHAQPSELAVYGDAELAVRIPIYP
jgi:hypothetical protein